MNTQATSPLVTICMICYNQRNYIRQAIDGVLNQQTKFPFLLLISDDNSSDDTIEIIKEYESRYPQFVKAVYHNHNMGAVPNFVQTLKLANTKYIAYCEGDDYWIDPLKLQKQISLMEDNPSYGFCYTDFLMYSEDSSKLSEPVFKNGLLRRPNSFEEHLFNSGYIAPMTWMFRKEVFDRANIVDKHTDGTFALALDFFQITNTLFVDEVTAVYRIHENSSANQKDSCRAFLYSKGVMATQLFYAQKYDCQDILLEKLRLQGYITNMFAALEAGDSSFVNEALAFYKEEGMEMGWFVEKCKLYVDFHQQFIAIRSSHAYRIGKKIVGFFKKISRL